MRRLALTIALLLLAGRGLAAPMPVVSIPEMAPETVARFEDFESRLDMLEPGGAPPDPLPLMEPVGAYLAGAGEASDPRLRELFMRVARDQFIRLSMSDTTLYEGLGDDQRFALTARVGGMTFSADGANTAWLKEQLSEIGWFRISDYGEAADNAAWLLVQHADREPEFQRSVLATLETLLEAGDTNPRNYAYLHDRVAMHAGEPSRYLTQGGCNAETGLWAPFEPEDSMEAANARREALGLDPITPERLEGTRQMCADFQGG